MRRAAVGVCGRMGCGGRLGQLSMADVLLVPSVDFMLVIERFLNREE
jgi:hypothetical protein